jgi:aryl-alcohol dehydrogenase-like predicted oxidoreductase
MAENLGALTLRLTDEDLAELEAVSALENRSVT